MVTNLNGYQLKWFPAGMVPSLNTADKYMKCGQFVFVYNLVTRNLPGKKLFS